ncbi:hypothetical protein D9Q98_008206 [Chlorella vulgaris]|uniref:DUF7880 domain-containing protein n=1 Tax=Chlorella vulgaris TaxID=3077 RepID=A0A9D4TGA0_CHLVU|nr:hypothetical protein D9Q98_008206 [Chlorella vulgaris]
MLCVALPSLGVSALAARHRRHQKTRRQARTAAAAAQDPSPACERSDKAAQQPQLPRRTALAAAFAVAATEWLVAGTAHAANEAVTSGLNKYVKRKKLERLDTYIAPLLEAKGQLVRVGRVMLQDAGEARQLLRSGVFAGLRDNVRSLGEYASQRAGDDSGRELVRGFFKELEGFDSELRKAQREGAGVEEARKRLDGTVAALERLLDTVPPEAMSQAQQVIAAIRELDDEAESEALKVDAGEASKLDKLL